MRRANLSRLALFNMTQISHSVLIEMKISFACYSLISHEYSNKPENIIVLTLNSKILSDVLLCFFFFCSVYIKLMTI